MKQTSKSGPGGSRPGDGSDVLRRFIEQAPATLAMFDTDMRYLAVSARWRRDYGLETVPLVGRSHYEVFPEIPERWKAVHQRCLEGDVEYHDEDLFVRSDGRHMWLRWEVQPWHTAAGFVGGLIIYSEDITHRLETESALHVSEERLRFALNASGAGTWRWDARTGDSTWDERFHALYGFPRGASPSFDAWKERLHDADRARVLALIDGVVRLGHDDWDIEFRSVHPDGRIVWHHGKGRAERDSHGNLIGLIGIDLDISARRPIAPTRSVADASQDDVTLPARVLAEASAQGIVTVDADGRILTANEAIEAMFGWSTAELIGQPIEVLVPAAARGVHAQHRAAYASAPRSRPMGLGLDLTGQRKDGAPFPVDISLNHIVTAHGLRTVAFVTDITVRKRVETTLRLHARLESLRADLSAVLSRPDPLRAVLQSAAEALVAHLGTAFFRIWTLNDATGVLELEASAGMYTHLDGSHARVPLGHLKIGRIAARRTPHLSNDTLSDPEISDREWARREGMLSFAGYPLLVENRVVGVMATFAKQPLSALVLQDLGAIASAVAQCVERKRAESALKASEERLRLMIDNAQHGLWEWDISTGAEQLDERWYRILGYRPGEVLPTYQMWERTIHPDDKAPVLALLQQHLDGQTSLFDVDYRARTKTGEWVWVNTRGRVNEREPDGRPRRMMGTIHDITARKLAEAEQQRLTAHLQRVHKLESLNVLAGGVAHDFNNLLMGILGNVTLALDDLAPDSLTSARLRSIERSAKRAADLARQMLAYTGKTPVVPSRFRLDELVGALRPVLERTAPAHADVGFELESALVSGDPVQVRQAVMNLFANAAEALTSRGGTIRVRTGARHVSADELRSPLLSVAPEGGRYAFVEIQDSGTGIDAQDLPRIFDPFFTTKFVGRGLGLAEALGTVQAHSGTITVRSAPGTGSTFCVFLPEAPGR